jgi:hypothetical protein
MRRTLALLALALLALRRLLGQTWRRLARLVACGRTLLAAGARAVAGGCAKLRGQVVSPLCCYGCGCAGVWLWFAVPIQLWNGLAVPAVAQLLPTRAALPDPYTVDALLIALALGLGVFREAYAQWQQSDAPLVARMLFIGFAGLSWPTFWRKTVRSWTDRQPRVPPDRT